MNYIKKYMDSYLDEMKPLSTGVESRINFNKKYRGFIFDIYGTLLISASGDVDELNEDTDNLREAVGVTELTILNKGDKTFAIIIDAVKNRIKNIHDEKRRAGIEYPEIVIEDVWTEVFSRFKVEGVVDFPDFIDFKEIIFRYELLANPVWKMPNMKNTIDNLKSCGAVLGIVSNAQFYTPIIMNYFLNGISSDSENISPFLSEISTFSYKKGFSKPDISIFDDINNYFDRNGIGRGDVLFIGNDMLKDIYTAKKNGYDAALFAGDKRSLRMRETDVRLNSIEPDHVVTDLKQIKELCYAHVDAY